MSSTVKFPLTNPELADAGGDKEPLFFPATWEEYWELLAEAEYRVDYYDHQIVASMSYESDLHSHFATRLTTLLGNIYEEKPGYRVYNSNRPVFIEDCKGGADSGVFNADGMVIALPPALYEYRPGMNAETAPTLLFEVLSETTRKYDFGIKLPCYKQIPSLKQILFVEQNAPGVIVFEREAPNRWMETALKAADDTFSVEGQAVSLRQIYRSVYF